MKDEVNLYIKKNLKKFKNIRKEVHKEPGTENVHDLRVALRRLHTLIKIYQLDPSIKVLKKAADRLGKVRDLDVSIENAKAFGLDAGELESDRKKQRKKVKKYFSKERQKDIEKVIRHTLKALKDKSENELQETITSYQEEIRNWKEVRLGRENFHQFRIALKKFRYLLESQGKEVKSLIRLQDLLGEIHDLEVLTEREGTTPEIQKRKLDDFFEAVELKDQLIQ